MTTGTGTDLFFEAATNYSPSNNDHDGVREKLRIIANAITNDATLPFRGDLWGYTLAVTPTGGGINEAPSVFSAGWVELQPRSAVNTRQYSLSAATNTAFGVGAGGFDGTAPVAATYLGNELAHAIAGPVSYVGFARRFS